MHIANETEYRTGPLREPVRRVAERELDKSKRREVRMRFKETLRGKSQKRPLRKGLGNK